MKTIIYAFIGSFLIHIIYIITPILVGYFQTKAFTPKISSEYESVQALQNEVAFGGMVDMNYFNLGASFVGVAIIMWCIILMVNRPIRKS